ARFLLGQLVIKVLRRDGTMRQWYKEIRRRRGSKIARVAVMRRLATIVWHILKKKEPYALARRSPAKVGTGRGCGRPSRWRSVRIGRAWSLVLAEGKPYVSREAPARSGESEVPRRRPADLRVGCGCVKPD